MGAVVRFPTLPPAGIPEPSGPYPPHACEAATRILQGVLATLRQPAEVGADDTRAPGRLVLWPGPGEEGE